MKKLFKSAAVLTVAALMAVCSVGFAACEDIKQLELDLSLYNYTGNAFYAESDVKFSVYLYRHLAPKTVDAILERVNAKYYEDAIFYVDTSKSSQIMMGDLKFDENGNLVLNKIDGKLPPEIYGEFEYGGTTGSNLVNAKGSVGLWRSYYENGSYKTSNAQGSGRATWFIPTSELSDYNGYFCVFAQYDTEDTANKTAIDALSAIFANADYYTEYVIYYTGEYNDETPDANDGYGLTFHAEKKADFDDDTEVFEAEGLQLVSFNKKTVKIPYINGEVKAKVKSVKVK